MAGCMGRGTGRTGRPALPAAPGLGERIRAERLRAGLTLAQLGSPVYQASFVGNVEHGRANPSLDALGHFAERLGVPIAQLLGADTAPIGAADAVGRAQRLLMDAEAVASPKEREVLAAVSAMLGALRRHLTGK